MSSRLPGPFSEIPMTSVRTPAWLALLIVGAGVSAQPYRSAFEGHRNYSDEPRSVPWRQANDEVGRIGGWRAYAREAQAAAAAASAASAPAAGRQTPP